MPVSYRWLPSPQAKITGPDGKPVPEFFNFFDEVSRRMGGQGGIADSCLLFSNQGVYTAAIIGSGLNLDRTTNTLTADGDALFPEAPLDGRQYGRQMAQWTVIVPTTSGGGATVPGLPARSVQYNSDPAGTFTGNAGLTVDAANSTLRVGDANSGSNWTIKPVDASAAATAGRTLTISAGKAGVSAGPGSLILTTDSGGGNPTTGNIQIITALFNSGNTTGAVDIATGGNTLGGGTGGITILSGTAGTGNSGNVSIASGGGTSTGAFSAKSGSGTTSGSGTAAYGSGSATGNQSGAVTLSSGGASGAFTASGSLSISTGNTAASGTSGNITISTGTGGTQGTITFSGPIGTLTFGASSRIQGDFTNATIASRTLFQTSVVTNNATDIGAIPLGTATLAYWTAYNNSTPTNSAIARIGVDVTAAYLDSSRVGTGTSLNLQFRQGNTPTVAGVMYVGGNWSFGTATTETAGAEKVQIGGSLSISSATMIRTYTAFTNGAAAAAGTLTNAPTAGDPTKWIPVNDNGTTRYIPAW